MNNFVISTSIINGLPIDLRTILLVMKLDSDHPASR